MGLIVVKVGEKYHKDECSSLRKIAILKSKGMGFVVNVANKILVSKGGK